MNVHSMPWFKFFASEWASDPKVQSMPIVMRYRLVMLWALCCQADPATLSDRERRKWFKISERELAKTYELFVAKDFMGPDWSCPKFWSRQAPTDPTAADRMREYRRRQAERSRNVTRNGSENGPVTERATPPRAREKSATEKSVEERGARARHVTAVTDPDFHATLGRVVALAGPDWGPWCERRHAEGVPLAWIEDAVRKVVKRGDVRSSLADGILASYRQQGGTDAELEGSLSRPPAPAGSPGPPPYIPEGPEGDAIRKMYGKEGSS